MSQNWVQDIKDMHTKFGVREVTRRLSASHLAEYLEFRIRFLQEELDEMKHAAATNNPEEVVDALIDLCVVAIGTLDAYDVNSYKAWDDVHVANMSKAVGVKASRPNPLGLPDLIKPEGWKAPSHKGNYGLIEKIYE
jgi:predicted HAD superfamily Cof-like phosphohydrolase